MAHASGCNSNLLYPVLERVLERYREVYADDADVVNAGLSELGHELQRQAQWADDYSSPNAYIEAGKLRLDARVTRRSPHRSRCRALQRSVIKASTLLPTAAH